MHNQDDLSQRLNLLEKRIETLEAQLKNPNQFQSQSQNIQKIIPQQVAVLKTPPKPNAFILWLKEDWLMKLGAVLVLMGLCWFVRFSFENNWIGPVGRITLGLIFGSLVLASGHLLTQKMRSAGQVLVGLGGLTLLMTVYSARFFYNIFHPNLAFAIMFVVIIVMAASSLFYQTRAVSFMALIGGFLIPPFCNSGTDNYFVLMNYLLLLNLGVLFVLKLKPWRSLLLTSLIGTAIYSFISFEHLKSFQIYFFMAALFSLYFLASHFAVFKSKTVGKVDLTISALNSLVTLIWIYNYIPEHLQSLVCVAFVVITGLSAYWIHHKKYNFNFLFINFLSASLFLAGAISYEFKGSALTICLSLESLLLIALSYYGLKSSKISFFFWISQIIPAFLVADHIDHYCFSSFNYEYNPYLFTSDFFAILIGSVSLILSGLILNKARTKNKSVLAVLNLCLGGLFLSLLIWGFTHRLINNQQMATMASLFIYTTVGIYFLYQGIKNNISQKSLVGKIILALVVCRLIFADMWEMPISGRIVTFFVIGILLLTTAFLQKSRKKNEK